MPIGDELWYWNNVLGSYRYLGLYSIQTSPLRFWKWSQSIYREVRQRKAAASVVNGWGDFYHLVRNVVHDRSIAEIQRRVATPMTLVQAEIRQKIELLERGRIINANGIGYVLGNTYNNDRCVCFVSCHMLAKYEFAYIHSTTGS